MPTFLTLRRAVAPPARPLSAALRASLVLAIAALVPVGGCGGGSASTDAGPPRDGLPAPDVATLDGAVVDCTGDHRESADHTNDPITVDNDSAEGTGFQLSDGAQPFTVCGQIDPAQANDMVVDGDVYQFTVTGSDPVNVRIEMTSPEGLQAHDLTLKLYRVDDGPSQVATGVFRNDYALVAGLTLAPGTYWVSAVAFAPAPSGPIGYTIQIGVDAFSCDADGGAPDYTESGDGGQSRGNDMVAVHYPNPPALTSAGDAPETTALVLMPGAIYHLRGTSAAIGSDGDNYLDRDTYLFATGAATTELQVRLTWHPDDTPDVDLDTYLFAASDPATDYSLGLGTTVDDRTDEVFTINVNPSTSYWLWTGAFDELSQGGDSDLPVTYDITLCPRTHGVPPPT